MALTRKQSLPGEPKGIVLSDNYNPIDCYDFEVREMMRKGVLELTSLELLLN